MHQEAAGEVQLAAPASPALLRRTGPSSSSAPRTIEVDERQGPSWSTSATGRCCWRIEPSELPHCPRRSGWPSPNLTLGSTDRPRARRAEPAGCALALEEPFHRGAGAPGRRGRRGLLLELDAEHGSRRSRPSGADPGRRRRPQVLGSPRWPASTWRKFGAGARRQRTRSSVLDGPDLARAVARPPADEARMADRRPGPASPPERIIVVEDM